MLRDKRGLLITLLGATMLATPVSSLGASGQTGRAAGTTAETGSGSDGAALRTVAGAQRAGEHRRSGPGDRNAQHRNRREGGQPGNAAAGPGRKGSAWVPPRSNWVASSRSWPVPAASTMASLPAVHWARSSSCLSRSPVGGANSSRDLIGHARQTRLFFDTSTPLGQKEVKTHIEFDFCLAAAPLGAQRATNAYTPTFRRGFITYGNWLLGQEWTTFQNPGHLPETTDFVV